MISIAHPLSSDISNIIRVHRQSWHETYDGILPSGKIDEMLDISEADQKWHFEEVISGRRPHHFVLVAKEDEQFVGFSDLWFDGDSSEIKAMYILKAHQRQGVGSSFLSQSLEWAQKSQKTFVDLVVENRPAIHFFEKHGFFCDGNTESFGGIKIVTYVLEKGI